MRVVDKHFHITCTYDGMKYHEILFYTHTHGTFLYLRPFLLFATTFTKWCAVQVCFSTLTMGTITFAVAID